MSFAYGFGRRNNIETSPKQLVKVESSEKSLPRNPNIEIIKEKIHEIIMSNDDLTKIILSDNESAEQQLRNEAQKIISSEGIKINEKDENTIIDELINDILGLGPLQPLLDRDDISDIMVKSESKIFIDVNGRNQLTPIRFKNKKHLIEICQKIASRVGRKVDHSNPFCDARLPDGTRVHIAFPPIVIDGPALTIRKFKKDKLSLNGIVASGAISAEGAELLKLLMRIRCNMIISGGTSSGKTSLLNSLTEYIDNSENIITCEDTHELQVKKLNLTNMETRPFSVETGTEVTMRDLVRNTLRMNPDRVIVGEVRGPEAYDLLWALRSGHRGGNATIHADTPNDALSQLEIMVSMAKSSLPADRIRHIVTHAIDIVIQCKKFADGTRKITHISEVMNQETDSLATQDILIFKDAQTGKDGTVTGRHVFQPITPKIFKLAEFYNEHDKLKKLMLNGSNN